MLGGNTSLLKRTYDYVAMFALLHVVAAVGVGAYLIGSGAVTPEKLRRVVAVLRDDDPATREPEDQPREPKAVLASAEVGGEIGFAPTSDDGELLRLEAQRIKAELDQRLTMNHNIMLRVTTQRDAFMREKQSAQEAARQVAKQRREEGFLKQLAIFEALSPKIAVEHLLNLPSSDEAARFLLEMDTRKARKIVESAKSGAELQRMQTILQRIRDVAPDRSVELEDDRPNP